MTLRKIYDMRKENDGMRSTRRLIYALVKLSWSKKELN